MEYGSAKYLMWDYLGGSTLDGKFCLKEFEPLRERVLQE